MSLPEQKAKAKAASNYAKIRKEIEFERLHPWSSAPAMRIGSFVVNPLSFRSMIDLEIAENAFFVDSEISEGDIAAYIWRHHPNYECGGDPAQVIKQVANEQNADALVAGIISHLSNPFNETPEASSFGSTSRQTTLPPIPSIAAICHEYGAAYGIDPQGVADIDLRIVFQCCRAQRISKGEKYSEPKRLRKAKSEFLTSHG